MTVRSIKNRLFLLFNGVRKPWPHLWGVLVLLISARTRTSFSETCNCNARWMMMKARGNEGTLGRMKMATHHSMLQQQQLSSGTARHWERLTRSNHDRLSSIQIFEPRPEYQKFKSDQVVAFTRRNLHCTSCVNGFGLCRPLSGDCYCQ